MASDDTTTVLDEADAAAVRLMVERLADHDVIEVFNLTGGWACRRSCCRADGIADGLLNPRNPFACDAQIS